MEILFLTKAPDFVAMATVRSSEYSRCAFNCAGLSEPSLLVYVINTKISCTQILVSLFSLASMPYFAEMAPKHPAPYMQVKTMHISKKTNSILMGLIL